MEINQNIGFAEATGKPIFTELKPMKGIDFDLELQRFEQAFRLNGLDAIESLNAKNLESNIDHALFEKIGEFKISVDTKMDEMHSLFNSTEKLSQKDLLKAQYQVGMFTVEVTIVSSGSDKVSDGIITLFQTK